MWNQFFFTYLLLKVSKLIKSKKDNIIKTRFLAKKYLYIRYITIYILKIAINKVL